MGRMTRSLKSDTGACVETSSIRRASLAVRLCLAGVLLASALAIGVVDLPVAQGGPAPTIPSTSSALAVGATSHLPESGWSVSDSGAVKGFNGAPFLGDMSDRSLSKPVVGMTASSTVKGYWLVASDGGVFSFGYATFFGSTGRIHLNQPIVGMAATPDGKGYWLVASDGGVFSFGDATFLGSAGDRVGFQAVGIVSSGAGYYIVASDRSWNQFGSTSPLAMGSQPVAAGTTPQTLSPSAPSTQPCCSATPPAEVGAPVPHVVGNSLVDSSGKPLRLLGFDVPGTQNACIEDKGISWGPFDGGEAKSMAAWHANAVRVPLNEDCWLGINGVSSQYSGTHYRQAIKDWVSVLNSAGLVVILDLFSVAPGGLLAHGQWPMADADHSITLWSQVASAFAANPSVIFDLFNEPFVGGIHPTTVDWACWSNGCTTRFALCPFDETTGEFRQMTGCPIVTYQTVGMQQLVDVVRAAGATQPIMVGGLNWSGDPCGIHDTGGNGTQCMWLANEPKDHNNQLIASFHTYDWTACTTTSCWNASVAPLATHVPVVTGEFGESDCSASYIDAFMNWADQHNVSYLAHAWRPLDSPHPSQCVPGPHTGNNFSLLENWSGAPSTLDPQGSTVQSHLARIDALGS
jgi:endoglucanase